MTQVIAIDGPSASGKSTVAKAVAKRLGFFYVDSGSIYRGITWHALENEVDIHDADAVIQNTRSADWVFRAEQNVAVFSINGYTPTDELRTARLSEAVSDVASMPKVRAFVNDRLRELTGLGSLTIDGRDIGSVVFPDTPYKFYLDADPAERAQRRYRELVETGEAEKAQEVLESLKRRDAKDSSREEAPLKVADGAYVINSTSMTIDEVVQAVIDKVEGDLR
ncbi:MAG: (d)CMP kinase [Kiritimatiellales bacterium]|nr:(d)CMP kinase [Kiritimatiellales bacterium]